MKDFVDVEITNQPALETVDYTAPGELLLIELGINLAALNFAEIPHWQLAHYIAIEYWLVEYQPPIGASNLEQVCGYLEAFHHLCEIEAWGKASQILFCLPKFPNSKQLHQQLGIWGCYREQIKMYTKILYKYNREIDCILLHNLIHAYIYTGQLYIAIKCCKTLLEISQNIRNRQAEARAHGGLGRIYNFKFENIQMALQHYQQQLSISRESGDLQQVAEALSGIGCVHRELRKFQQALHYQHEALKITYKINDLDMTFEILGIIGSIHTTQGKYKKAVEFIKQQLEWSRKKDNRRQQWVALHNLGSAYISFKNFPTGLELLHEALRIIRDIGDLSGESITLNSIGAVYGGFGDYYSAIDYFYHVLTITNQINDILGKGIALSNLSYCYGCTKKYNKAVCYSYRAIKIAKEIHHQELMALAISTLANAHWHKGKFFCGLILIAKSILIYPPWKTETSQRVFKIAIETICLTIKESLNKLLTLL